MTPLPDPIPWVFAGSLSLSYKHSLVWRVEGLPIQKESHTPMRDSEVMGKANVSYWIDGDDRCFNSEDELRKAWEARDDQPASH